MVEAIEPDRLDPGPGPRLRSAATCATPRPPPTAFRRWSRRARSSASQGPKGKREVPVEEYRHRPGQDLARSRRDRRVVHSAEAADDARATPTCASSRAPRWTSRSSASASASRMKGDTVHRRARRPRRGRADACCWSPEAAKALIGSKLDDAALDARGRRLLGGVPADRRQARHHRVPHQDRRRAGAARRADRARPRNGIEHGNIANMAKIHVTTTINGDADRVSVRAAARRCSTCCATNLAPDRHQGRLRLGRLRRVQRHGRRPAGLLVPGARRRRPRAVKIETIEGMAEGDKLHPLQQKFLEHAALQCGICTPGFLIASKALLASATRTRPRPKSATGWPATCAAAPATTRSSSAVLDVAAEMREQPT